MKANIIIELLEKESDSERIPQLQRFFKTNKGEYGEGDKFIGVKVPDQRTIAKNNYKLISLEEITPLITSEIHEYRHTALIMLVEKYKSAKSFEDRTAIFDYYIENIEHINNWDLVDCSTHKIVGPYIHETENFDYLYSLSNDTNMWKKRIAVVSLWYLWKKGYISQGLELIRQNIDHPHDLMHKATGWMLKELGKINEDVMLEFVVEHYDLLPRTCLRYAIEKVDEPLRTIILKKEF